DILARFFAYTPTFLGGVNVAAGDLNGDGKVEIVTGAGAGGGPHVRIFSLAPGAPTTGDVSNFVQVASNTKIQSEFFAYAPNFLGGVNVALGDVTGDGKLDIITGAGPGGGPHVRVFDTNKTGLVEAFGFFAYAPGFTGGVTVAAGDYNNDGKADIVTGAGFGGGPHVRVFSRANPAILLADYFAFLPGFNGLPIPDDLSVLASGVTSVGFQDVDGDGLLDILVGSGKTQRARVRVFKGNAGASLVPLALPNIAFPTDISV